MMWTWEASCDTTSDPKLCAPVTEYNRLEDAPSVDTRSGNPQTRYVGIQNAGLVRDEGEDEHKGGENAAPLHS